MALPSAGTGQLARVDGSCGHGAAGVRCRLERPPPVPGQKVSSIQVPVAFAELIDKITILEIKSEQLKGQGKGNVDHELGLLRQVLEQSGVKLLPEHIRQLKVINQALWRIEDDIRGHEHRQDFGEKFIQLARSVYQQNDQRAKIKRLINDYYGSDIKEEKSYSVPSLFQ